MSEARDIVPGEIVETRNGIAVCVECVSGMPSTIPLTCKILVVKDGKGKPVLSRLRIGNPDRIPKEAVLLEFYCGFFGSAHAHADSCGRYPCGRKLYFNIDYRRRTEMQGKTESRRLQIIKANK